MTAWEFALAALLLLKPTAALIVLSRGKRK
jgi:hypothetical protein